jgi:hypothetical protein
MEHPVRVSFCKILFGKNGGSFTETGLPILQPGELDDDTQVRGKCSRAYDCGSCSYMQEWLVSLQEKGWHVGWECDRCLRESRYSDAETGVTRQVQGFFQAGRKKDKTQDDPDFDPDLPGLEGCTKCGWESSFLQLVLRK